MKSKVIRLIPFLVLILILNHLFTGCTIKFLNNVENENASETEVLVNVDRGDALNNINEVTSKMKSIRNSDSYVSEDFNGQKETMMKEIRKMADDGLVKSDSISYDDDSRIISYSLPSGILCFEKIGGFDENYDEYAADSNTDPMSLYYGSTNLKQSDCIILDGMTDRTNVTEKCKELAADWSAKGICTTIDLEVTLDDLTNLKEYEFVYFKMHGSYIKKINGETAGFPVVCLEQEQNDSTNQKYYKDLNDHSIIFLNDCYCVAPSFFSNHYKYPALKNNIFFFGCCELMGTGNTYSDLMSYAFANTALRCFVANHNSIYTDYNLELVDVFLNQMILGKTAHEAFDVMINECGSDDEIWCHNKYPEYIPYSSDRDAAYPMLKGNEDAVICWDRGSDFSGDDACYIDTFYEFKTEYEDRHDVDWGLYFPDDGDEPMNIKDIYYCLTDINGDGIKELILSRSGQDDIAALYTRSGKEVINLSFQARHGSVGITSDGYIYEKYKFVLMYELKNSELKEIYSIYLDWDYDGDPYEDLDNRDKAERRKHGISSTDMTFSLEGYTYPDNKSPIGTFKSSESDRISIYQNFDGKYQIDFTESGIRYSLDPADSIPVGKSFMIYGSYNGNSAAVKLFYDGIDCIRVLENRSGYCYDRYFREKN